jgi:hypothetical protein
LAGGHSGAGIDFHGGAMVLIAQLDVGAADVDYQDVGGFFRGALITG